jgi:hypothetical protein
VWGTPTAHEDDASERSGPRWRSWPPCRLSTPGSWHGPAS